MPPDQKKTLTGLLTSQVSQIEARITALVLQKTQAAETRAKAKEVINTSGPQAAEQNSSNSKAIDLYA